VTAVRAGRDGACHEEQDGSRAAGANGCGANVEADIDRLPDDRRVPGRCWLAVTAGLGCRTGIRVGCQQRRGDQPGGESTTSMAGRGHGDLSGGGEHSSPLSGSVVEHRSKTG
jgi:hypothetical protein